MLLIDVPKLGQCTWALLEGRGGGCAGTNLNHAHDSMGSNPALPLVDLSTCNEVCDQVMEANARSENVHREKAPWLLPEIYKAAKREMRDLELVGGIFDKKPSKFFGCCNILIQQHLASSIICGKFFDLLGWGHSPVAAQTWALREILRSASESGVLRDASTQNAIQKALIKEEDSEAYLSTFITSLTADRMSRLGNEAKLPQIKTLVRPPGVNSIFKWKSEVQSGLLKWRDIVTFVSHPLSIWGKIVGRCLGLVVKGVMEICNHIATPLMRGVRDMFASCVRIYPNWSSTHVAEIDQDDQDWQIDKHEVKLAFTWAAKKMKPSRNGASSLWLSISKVCKQLDRLGTSTSSDFRQVKGNKWRDIWIGT